MGAVVHSDGWLSKLPAMKNLRDELARNEFFTTQNYSLSAARS